MFAIIRAGVYTRNLESYSYRHAVNIPMHTTDTEPCTVLIMQLGLGPENVPIIEIHLAHNHTI